MESPQDRTQRIACRLAEDYERSQGREPQDVHYGYQPSCDYVSRSPGGAIRYIEVKGLGGSQLSVKMPERQRLGALGLVTSTGVVYG